jgi:[acyl-carrier-protein] S-malonyltransferase
MKAGVFPGQGVPAQQVLDALPRGDEHVEQANELLGYDLRARVSIAARREGAPLPTKLAQPAIFVASVRSWRRAADEGATFDAFAGHSLGEYAALVAGGAISFPHALCAVAVRGEAMERAAKASPGGMVALLGLDFDGALEVARRSGCVVANDNAPGQVVLSGTEAGLAAAGAAARDAGGRAILLEVSGAFHSGAVAGAQSALRHALDHVDIRSPHVPVVSNITARPYRAPGEIRRLLVDQVVDRVGWRESMEWLWHEGAREVHDFGPGRVVAGLAEKTFRMLERRVEVAHA